MSDLIERDKVIEYCLKLIDVERKQGSDVMNYGQERINQTDAIIAFVENLPSAESSWTSVLAELHERFDALEKEIRKASAEMSAIIREYVDRPKGEWVDAEIPLESGDTMPIQVCNLCKTFYPLAYTGGGQRFCPNCGADMRGE